MAEDLFLKLDSKVWKEYDFDDTDGITGTVYTDRAMTSAKNLTGFTITLNLYRRWHRVARISQTATAVVAASGTWKWLPTEGDMPISGVYNAEIELTQDGLRKSTINDVEVHVKRGP